MDLAKIDQIARDSMAERREAREREPGWIYYHGRRTARLALWLCGELDSPADRDVLYAGALFHDVGKGVENHHEIGAAAARDLLRGLCTDGELEAVCDIVAKHCLRNHSLDFPEAVRIVQDADLLDHFGPIQPWLSFYWSGVHGEAFHDHMDFVHREENRQSRQKMRESLNYDPAKRMFDERIAVEDEFFSRFHRVYLEGM
jgi:uncharacterized protein